MRHHQHCLLFALICCGAFCLAMADDSADSQQEAAARLDLMQKTIAGFDVQSDEVDVKSRLAFADKPVLRYSDPTRGLENETTLLDASV